MNEKWLSYATTQQRLGIGKKEIDNLVNSGVLRSRFEAMPSGKTARRYRDTDVNRIALEYEGQRRSKVPLEKKLWLTPEEAAAYSGLWKNYLVRQVKLGRIVGRKSGKGGRLVLLRKSIQEFTPPREEMGGRAG